MHTETLTQYTSTVDVFRTGPIADGEGVLRDGGAARGGRRKLSPPGGCWLTAVAALPQGAEPERAEPGPRCAGSRGGAGAAEAGREAGPRAALGPGPRAAALAAARATRDGGAAGARRGEAKQGESAVQSTYDTARPSRAEPSLAPSR